MRYRKLLVLLIPILVLTAESYSQSTLTGKVVKVLDGKTIVLEVSTGKLTAELQFVEVPEPEQPLYQTVREHLERLVLNKDVTFRSAGFAPGKAFGQIYVNSTDIALQMLRDGAAWHVNPEKSGQEAGESDAYEYHQTQARLEKRGVWGVAGMRPAWEFRAEKFQRERDARIASERGTGATASRYETASVTKTAVRPPGVWSDKNPSLKNPGPLLHGYNAATKTGWLSTFWMGVKEEGGVSADRKLVCDVTYLYKQESEKVRTGKFHFTLVSVADEWRFLTANTLSVIVDEKTVAVAKPKKVTSKEDGRSVEKLGFEISKAAIEKIVFGGDVVIKIGTYTMFPGDGVQLLLYNMLQAAE